MNKNFDVVMSEMKKVSVVISRRALWDNAVACWKEFVWDDYTGLSSITWLKDVADILLTNEDMDEKKLRELFRKGDTVLLMGAAMNFLDVAYDEIYREIVITDDNGKRYVIPHEDIVF